MEAKRPMETMSTISRASERETHNYALVEVIRNASTTPKRIILKTTTAKTVPLSTPTTEMRAHDEDWSFETEQADDWRHDTSLEGCRSMFTRRT